MASNNTSYSGGIGFFGLLGIAFIVLKLCNVINWSWWWILAPLWGPGAIVLGLGAFFLIATGFALGFIWIFDSMFAKKHKRNR